MAAPKLKDADAKAVLLKWPTRTSKLWDPPTGSGYWIRAQPRDTNSKIATPTLRTPGSSLFKTQPDGMWAFLNNSVYADVICVEVCGTQQNLNDKRSRYAADVRSLVLNCPLKWLTEAIALQKAGTSPRWQACGSIPACPTEELNVPVRFLRVLFALPNELYKAWTAENIPDGHEYYCRHSSLDSYNSQNTQAFVSQMAIRNHFLTVPGR